MTNLSLQEIIIGAVGGLGFLIILIGITPIMTSINAGTDVMLNAFEKSIPILVIGMILTGFATALAER